MTEEEKDIEQSEYEVYQELLAELRPSIERLGLSVDESLRGWVKIEDPLTHEKLYIRKAVATLPRVETTLEGIRGARPIDRSNGRIRSVLEEPTIEVLEQALEALARPQGTFMNGGDRDEVTPQEIPVLGSDSRRRRRPTLRDLLEEKRAALGEEEARVAARDRGSRGRRPTASAPKGSRKER